MSKKRSDVELRAEIEELGGELDAITEEMELMLQDSERGRPIDWIMLGEMLREAGRMRDRFVRLLLTEQGRLSRLH